MDESCHAWDWVTWSSHVTQVNQSCPTYERVIALMEVSHVAHMDVSWHTYEWVMAHVWMRYGTHESESCRIYRRQWTKAPPSTTSHVTRMNKSTHTYGRFISQMWTSQIWSKYLSNILTSFTHGIYIYIYILMSYIQVEVKKKLKKNHHPHKIYCRASKMYVKYIDNM